MKKINIYYINTISTYITVITVNLFITVKILVSKFILYNIMLYKNNII